MICWGIVTTGVLDASTAAPTSRQGQRESLPPPKAGTLHQTQDTHSLQMGYRKEVHMLSKKINNCSGMLSGVAWAKKKKKKKDVFIRQAPNAAPDKMLPLAMAHVAHIRNHPCCLRVCWKNQWTQKGRVEGHIQQWHSSVFSRSSGYNSSFCWKNCVCFNKIKHLQHKNTREKKQNMGCS